MFDHAFVWSGAGYEHDAPSDASSLRSCHEYVHPWHLFSLGSTCRPMMAPKDFRHCFLTVLFAKDTMRFLLIIAATGGIAGLFGSSANAEPLLDCKNVQHVGPVEVRACADESFVALDKSVSSQFDAAIAAADPLTATLLRQESLRRSLVMDSTGLISEDAQVERGLAFLRKSMLRDKTILDAIGNRVPDGIAGQWSNAFATVRLTPRSDDRYHLTIERSWVEKERDEALKDQVPHCVLEFDIKRAADGWYEGTLNPGDKVATKVTRQGASLRLVLGHDEENYDGRKECGFHDAVSGTYFLSELSTDTARSAASGAIEKPSFSCKDVDGAVEMEICSDPELARQDRALAIAFKNALGRVDAETAKYLKADQVAWIARRENIYSDALSPAADKMIQQEDNYGDGRQSLLNDTRTHIEFLTAIEGRREHFVGRWASMSSTASITRGANGKFILKGRNGGVFYHDGECDYEAKPSIVKGVLTADVTYGPNDADGGPGRETPKVWSDGRTLVIDSDLAEQLKAGAPADDDHPTIRNYCTRNHDAIDRLFPVNATIKYQEPD